LKAYFWWIESVVATVTDHTIAKNSIKENSIARTTEFGAEENISVLGKEMYFISKKKFTTDTLSIQKFFSTSAWYKVQLKHA
jgi:hypothetical protein